MTVNYEDLTIEVPIQIPLTPNERDFRDRFVLEYLADFDYTGAAIRLGFPENVAQLYGRKFKHDSYVRQRIAHATSTQWEDPEAVMKQQKQRVLSSLLKEANYKGPGASHSARVAALAKLAQIHGLEAPTKTKSEIIHKGSQNINLNHGFDFSKMDADSLALVRQLLTKQVESDDQPK